MKADFYRLFKDNIISEIKMVPRGKKREDNLLFFLSHQGIGFTLNSLKELIGDKRFYLRTFLVEPDFIIIRIYFE